MSKKNILEGLDLDKTIRDALSRSAAVKEVGKINESYVAEPKPRQRLKKKKKWRRRR
jgi:hypothetical protein